MDLLRRRNMMQGMGNISPYPDPWEDDGKVWAYYDISTTESATKLCYKLSTITGMEVDGESITPAISYQFSTTGEHLVKFSTSSNVLGDDNGFFRDVSRLRRVYFPSKITVYHSFCLGLMSTRADMAFLPKTVTSISNNAFSQSGVLFNDLDFPNLSSIGNSTFYGALFDKVVNIGRAKTTGYSFCRDNKLLTSVVLPETITAVADSAFSGCSKLTSLTIKAVTPPSLAGNALSGTPGTLKIYVPAESVDTYKSASGWSSHASKIQAIV